MKLTLQRIHNGVNYTIGKLSIEGKYFCDTLEDAIRPLPVVCPSTPKSKPCTCSEKEYSKTAIPAGTYSVTLKLSPRFKRVLPYLHDVPHFLGILIHSGNTAEDSAGCILVGKNSAKGRLTNSRATSDALNKLLASATEAITIEII